MKVGDLVTILADNRLGAQWAYKNGLPNDTTTYNKVGIIISNESSMPNVGHDAWWQVSLIPEKYGTWWFESQDLRVLDGE